MLVHFWVPFCLPDGHLEEIWRRVPSAQPWPGQPRPAAFQPKSQLPRMHEQAQRAGLADINWAAHWHLCLWASTTVCYLLFTPPGFGVLCFAVMSEVTQEVIQIPELYQRAKPGIGAFASQDVGRHSVTHFPVNSLCRLQGSLALHPPYI